MASVFWAIAVICSIFWTVFLLRSRHGIPQYSKFELILFFLLSHVVPGLILCRWNLNMWRNAVAELVVFALLYFYVQKSKDQVWHSCIYAVYLFQPGTILTVLYGGLPGMLAGMAALPAVLALDRFVKKRGGSLRTFLPEYLLMQGGVFLRFAAGELSGQKAADMAVSDAAGIPVVWIVSAAFMGTAVGLAVYRVIKGEYRQTAVTAAAAEKECGCFGQAPEKLQVKDILLMGLLTLLFAVVVLWRLGSVRVPETYEKFRVGEPGENEIILEFREPVELSRICLYLGCQGKRILSFSCMEENGEQWQVFDSSRTVESCFCWNEIPVNRPVKLLGMVLMEGEASIHEIVCLDQYGNRVLPVNAGYYDRLFDEQALYPEKATYYYRTMFDEVYHARTAYEFLHRLPIYENTHPPLGKTLISIGIRIFGMNPFGWRSICALCGILMVPLIYLFAHRMFKTTASACFASVLLCTEFMHFTLSRIATLDIIAALFILLMFFFMYGFVSGLEREERELPCRMGKQWLWLLLCGCSMAAAISVKWTGFYAGFGIAILFFTTLWQRLGNREQIQKNRGYLGKLFVLCVLCFVVLPLTVYTLSYLPFTRVYQNRGLAAAMLENSRLMLTYHVDCVFEHPYSSEWYDWIIDRKPLLDSYTVLEDGCVSAVATLGNPLLVWAGLASFLHQIYLWRCRKCKNAGYLVLAFLSVFMPWMFIHRTLFIYHYLPGILLLILMITNSFCYMKGGNRGRIVFAALSLGLFAMYYPVLSGAAVKAEYMNQILEWMHTWRFAL